MPKNTSATALCIMLAFAGAIAPKAFPGDKVTVDDDSAVAYILACRKPNGAFGPADQQYTDAAWNYPAVQALLLLKQKIANPAAVLQHGLGYPKGHAGYGHWLFFHQHRIRQLLGRPMKAAEREVELAHQGFEIRYYGSPFGTGGDVFFAAGSDGEPEQRDVTARQLGYYNLSSLYYLLQGLADSGRQASNRDELIAFIRDRQAPGGGFVDVRMADGKPTDDDAHIAHTFHALASLKLLQAETPALELCRKFIHSCRLADGAFRWNPRDDLPGNRADIYYTWAAVCALDLLGKRPDDASACAAWINSLQNHDGGFGDRPGWRSRLYSTYYAVDALSILTGDARRGISTKRVERRKHAAIADDCFEIYQALFKTPVCAVDDLAALNARGFHLLALKSDRWEDAEALRRASRNDHLPIDVVLCPEAYSHRARQRGGALLHHIGNFTLDSSWSDRQRARWHEANTAGQMQLPWREYERRVIGEVRRLGGLCYPEQDFEMEFAYSVYDAGLPGDDGYNAMLAGFNWSPRDFVRVFPWRERYVDKLTPIADADAHGDLAKWSPQLDHVRNLFIAEGSTYADFQTAAEAGRVVCVVYDPQGVGAGVSYYGREPAVNFVKRRIDQWRWWPEARK